MRNWIGSGACLVFLCGVTSCSKAETSSKAKNKTSTATEELSATLDTAATTDAPAGANACLLAYAQNYDRALPLATVAAVTGLSAANAKVEYSRVMKNPAFQHVSYSWPSTRTRSFNIGGREIQAPQSNIVEFGLLRPMTVQYFRNSYRPIKEHEEKELDARIENSKDARLATDDSKKTAREIGGALAEVTRAYRDVPGVGEAASFNTVESALYVLDRGVSFRVTANLSDDADANQAKAIELAKKVMESCP